MADAANTGYVPEAPKFDLTHDWKIYHNLLGQLFIAYGVTDEKRKAAILQTAVLDDAFRILTNIYFPKTPSEKTYDELCKLLKEHFAPIVSIFDERQKFYDAKQEKNESVTEWSTRLRGLAVTCEFNDHQDKFVTGTSQGPILNKLFELEASTTFAKCVEAALKREMTTKQKSQTLEINKMHAKRNNFQAKNKLSNDRPSTISCYACGKQNHNCKTCRYKSFKCTKCNTVGHIAAVCRKSNKKSSNFINTENADTDLNASDDSETLNLFNTEKITNEEKNHFIPELKINNVGITFEIDTGAAVSVCSKRLYVQHFSSIPMKIYSNSAIRNTEICL